MDLRGQDPKNTFQYLVTTDGTHLFNGTGSLMTSLTITSITSSFVTESFISSSFITASAVKVVNDLSAATIRSPGFGPGFGGIQDSTLIWNSRTADQSYYQLNEVGGGGSIQLFYSWNSGGNAEELVTFDTNSINFVPPLNLFGIANTLLYATGSGNVVALPNGISVNLTSSLAQTASSGVQFFTSVNPILTWDADTLNQGNIVGFARYPTKGVNFFWQSGSGDPPVTIFRTIGSQSVWQDIQNFTTASGYWSGRASSSITSSAISALTASAPPANTASVVAWLSINVSGSIYKLPLYQ